MNSDFYDFEGGMFSFESVKNFYYPIMNKLKFNKINVIESMICETLNWISLSQTFKKMLFSFQSTSSYSQKISKVNEK